MTTHARRRRCQHCGRRQHLAMLPDAGWVWVHSQRGAGARCRLVQEKRAEAAANAVD